MKKNSILTQLHEIHKKMQHNEFVTKAEGDMYDAWVVKTYASTPVAQVIIEIPSDQETKTLSFNAPPLQSQLILYPKQHKDVKDLLCIKPYILKKLPNDEMIAPIRSMASPFALLPDGLNEFQIRQLNQSHFLIIYAGAYIIREGYKKSLCPLPKVDNRIKSFCNVWSDRWLRIANLCLRCRELLSPEEAERFPKSWNWLDEIVSDYRRNNFLQIKGNVPLVPTEEVVGSLRIYADRLKEGSVHFAVDKKSEPNLYKLLTVAKEYASNDLDAYISSVRRYASELEVNENVRAVGYIDGLISREFRGTQKKKKA